MASVVDVLRGARELLADPKDFWQGGGTGTRCAMIAVGEVFQEGHDHCDGVKVRTLTALGHVMGCESWEIPTFNDSHTHAEVLAAFDTAIAAEEAKAAEHTPADGIPVHRPEYGDVPGWAIPTGDPRRTQNADTLLEVMTVCDLAGQIVGELVAKDPNVTASAVEISALASQELFAAAQDVAKAALCGIVVERA